jgi:UDP-N-acetyl-D-glucosamine dehydrogenase
MIESSMMINDKMPEYCVERASKILNEDRKPLNGSKILILGVAYKQDIDDYRESPAIKVIEILERCGTMVDFYDPFVQEYSHKGEKRKGLSAITPEIVQEYDLVMITTAHTKVDYTMVSSNAQKVFDTKNAMKDVVHRKNIILL